MDWCIIMLSPWCPRVWTARHNHLVTLLSGPLIHWDQRPRLRTWEDEGFDMGKSYSSPILHFMIWCIIMLSHWCLRVWALGHTHLGILPSGPSDYGDGRPRLMTGGGLESSYGKGTQKTTSGAKWLWMGHWDFHLAFITTCPGPVICDSFSKTSWIATTFAHQVLWWLLCGLIIHGYLERGCNSYILSARGEGCKHKSTLMAIWLRPVTTYVSRRCILSFPQTLL